MALIMRRYSQRRRCLGHVLFTTNNLFFIGPAPTKRLGAFRTCGLDDPATMDIPADRKREQVGGLHLAACSITAISGGPSMSVRTHDPPDHPLHAAPDEVQVIPLVAGHARLHVRRVETGGGVRVRTRVSERVEEIDTLLRDETVQVERRESGRIVPAEQAPVAHYEGDTLVLPVLEEVLVTEKRIRIKEELHITRIPA